MTKLKQDISAAIPTTFLKYFCAGNEKLFLHWFDSIPSTINLKAMFKIIAISGKLPILNNKYIDNIFSE